jgi:hypothetical protein
MYHFPEILTSNKMEEASSGSELIAMPENFEIIRAVLVEVI